MSDEVYAAHTFPSRDVSSASLSSSPINPFTSILSIPLSTLGVSASLIHVVYSMSKDFNSNGLRLGAIVLQRNRKLLDAIRPVSNFSWPSSMSEAVWTAMLDDADFLSMYEREFRSRMSRAYDYATSVLHSEGIPYDVCYAGPYIWVDLSAYLGKVPPPLETGPELRAASKPESASESELETTFQQELDLAYHCLRVGRVWISPGQQYDAMVPGRFRVTFAINEKDLRKGMERLVGVLRGGSGLNIVE